MASTFRRLSVFPARILLGKRGFSGVTKPKVDPIPDTATGSNAERESARLADQARASQNLWDFMVPEKNMSVTHPFFLVLLALTVSLHFYNQHRDQVEDEELRKKRLGDR